MFIFRKLLHFSLFRPFFKTLVRNFFYFSHFPCYLRELYHFLLRTLPIELKHLLVLVLNTNNIVLNINLIVLLIFKYKQYFMTYCYVLCNLFMHLRSGPGPAPPRRPGGPPHRAGGGPARPGPRPPNGRGVLPSWHRPSGDEGGRYLPSSDSEESGPVMRAGPRPGSKTGGRAAMRAHVSNSHHPVHSGRSPSSSFWQPFHVAII